MGFYTDRLGFGPLDDTFQPEQNKRRVVVGPPGGSGTTILLARATTPEQCACIGNQTGGRVFLFLATDDSSRDHARLEAAGVTFLRQPATHSCGTVAVFADLYGNLWDLIEYAPGHPMCSRAGGR